ncbi:hypothetical protein NDU88_004415 [Pleurodeles waltl]|uniref:Uncharacterized protein n=1 Tax=Pleurodeles waltl TaxID=8319 RepID=A0AAV7T7B8_PLEWA|nr:hypothetical protein NDU88_004415 [Pleurodeles waltl]
MQAALPPHPGPCVLQCLRATGSALEEADKHPCYDPCLQPRFGSLKPHRAMFRGPQTFACLPRAAPATLLIQCNAEFFASSIRPSNCSLLVDIELAKRVFTEILNTVY